MNTPTAGQRGGIGGFFAWWTDELSNMLPSFLRGNAAADRTLLLSLDDERASLQLLKRRQPQALGEILLSTDVLTQRSRFQALLNELRLRDPVVGVVLPVTAGLVRTLRLPLAVEKDLGQVIHHQLDRLTPYQATQIDYDFRVTERHLQQGEIEVEFIAVPKETVRQAVERVESWGGRVAFVDLDRRSTADTGQQYLNLARDRVRPAQSSNPWRRLDGLLLAANLLVLAVILGLMLWQRVQTEAALDERLEAAQTKAQVVARLRSRIKAIEDEQAFLVNTRQGSPAAIHLLDDLSRALPDGVWLEQLALQNKELQLTGYSPRATELIQQLENSEYLRNVRFRASITQDDRVGAERFRVAADIAGEPSW